jgi:hypothetical protein
MKKVRQSISIALLAIGSAAHAAGNVQGATVINVDARADGNFLITFSQSSTTPPSCVAVFNRMSGTTSTAGGRAVLANAMLAFASGARIALAQGTGACSTYSDIESINILSLGQ